VSSSDERELSERLRETEALLAEANAEKARLWAELNERRATDHELAEVRKMVAQMQGSPSWRVTAPLRSVKRALHGKRELARRGVRALGRE
jgi:hypothetical protein